jgi:hypothetical protein
MRENGPTGLFRGLSATISRDVPFTFFFFGGYEAWTLIFSSMPYFIVKNENTYNSTIKLNSVGIYLAGGFAGATAWSIIFPVDSVKSNLQTMDKSTSLTTVVKDMYISQGLKGFYRGWSSAIMRAFPANAALFLGYETTISLLGVT